MCQLGLFLYVFPVFLNCVFLPYAKSPWHIQKHGPCYLKFLCGNSPSFWLHTAMSFVLCMGEGWVQGLLSSLGEESKHVPSIPKLAFLTLFPLSLFLRASTQLESMWLKAGQNHVSQNKAHLRPKVALPSPLSVFQRSMFFSIRSLIYKCKNQVKPDARLMQPREKFLWCQMFSFWVDKFLKSLRVWRQEQIILICRLSGEGRMGRCLMLLMFYIHCFVCPILYCYNWKINWNTTQGCWGKE